MGRKDKSQQVEGVDTITGTPLQQQAMHNCCKSVCRCRRTDRRWIYWKTLFMLTEELERVEEEEDNRKRGSWRKQTVRETKHELIRKYLHLFDNMNTNKYTKMCKYRNTQTLETDWHNRKAPGLQGELCLSYMQHMMGIFTYLLVFYRFESVFLRVCLVSHRRNKRPADGTRQNECEASSSCTLLFNIYLVLTSTIEDVEIQTAPVKIINDSSDLWRHIWEDWCNDGGLQRPNTTTMCFDPQGHRI